MEKALVAQRVANHLATTENAVDAAIKETSQLLGGLLDARQELKTSAVFGDDAARKVMDAIAALSTAQMAKRCPRRDAPVASLYISPRSPVSTQTWPPAWIVPNAPEQSVALSAVRVKP